MIAPDVARGSIPAQAGEPYRGCWDWPRTRVYPRAGGGTGRPQRVRDAAKGLSRAGGGTRYVILSSHFHIGLSPRRRGNPRYGCCCLPTLRSIPAQAGEPPSSPAATVVSRVYPRAGGGTVIDAATSPAPQGLSPRRRGTRKAQTRLTLNSGLSPRRRGNPVGERHPLVVLGSIPAQAGEPCRCGVRKPCSRVYPRAGGGTDTERRNADGRGGLSPRRRGNQRNWERTFQITGSIPAQAGEPASVLATRSRKRVYPRAGGGTVSAQTRLSLNSGLSPRRRGNRRGSGRPAPMARVYPRAGGGTAPENAKRPRPPGLSPRRRGNHDARSVRHVSPGSIPAQAGEPRSTSLQGPSRKVYPRAGGGTEVMKVTETGVAGLSPRRRGNHGARRDHHRLLGSIPAQAGEPNVLFLAGDRDWVYPRAGGGTPSANPICWMTKGLSPRRRGNPFQALERQRELGSIPAQAGESLVANSLNCLQCQRT